MSTPQTEPEFDDEGQILDFLTQRPLQDRPEERVRQKFLRILHFEHGYPKEVMEREVPIERGSQVLLDQNGDPMRADIAVYEDELARTVRDQGRIRFVVENKAPDEESGHNQLVSYVFNTSANGAVWYNGTDTKWYHRLSVPENKLIAWPGIPGPGESWDAVGRQRKSQLVVPTDIKGLFRRCHNKLHRRGTPGDDATLDMVRIIIAKCRDEEKPGDVPEFYCTAEEYSSVEGRALVAARVQALFEEFRDANPLVFEEHERIGVGPDQVADAVSELQTYRLISDDEHQWDIMGAVYEEYTADELKRRGGEFFTNRLVVKLLVDMLDPGPDDTMLDPAGGTGGFCTAALRHMRQRVRNSGSTPGVKRRLIQQVCDSVFYIDIKHRLVKIAKTAMLLTGNGHRGCIQGDSLAPMHDLDASFLQRCRPGTLTRLLTNPPFAGLANGRITDPHVLNQFDLGKRWEWNRDVYRPTSDLSTLGTPPESLFLERCLQWAAPGAIVGIVQPKGVLDTTDPHLATRHLIFRKAKLLAVINCHKNTFQPYTGSRTTLLVLQKKDGESEFADDDDYPIFMAISRKIGQDSQGEPIYKTDEQDRPTTQLDHDLDEILRAWLQHKLHSMEPSEYVFSIRKSDLQPRTLNINPQRYLPALNESLRQVLRMGDAEGWSVSTIGQIPARVYKGSRFKREDLETQTTSGPEVRAYFTPGAMLQSRGDSIKYLDLSRAPESRKRTILAHVLNRGQILVTRSGTIGRVTYVTEAHDGQIGSDDLIRIEIDDEDLRYYVYAFLKTDLAHDQMMRNEYGTIQQHLEPRHVADIVVPIPDDETIIRQIAQDMRRSIETQEESRRREGSALRHLQDAQSSITPD